MKAIVRNAGVCGGIMLALASCGENDDSPSRIALPILWEFNQESASLDLAELTQDEKDDIKCLTTKTFVVNGYDEFPECGFISDDWEAKSIDFEGRSVIVNYQLCAYRPVGHDYGWIYDYNEDERQFVVSTAVDGDFLLDDDMAYIVRNAIMVNEVAPDTPVSSVFSVGSLSAGTK